MLFIDCISYVFTWQDTNLTTFSGTEQRSTTVCTISLTRAASNFFLAGLFGKAGDGFPVRECVARILKKKDNL